MVLFVFGQEDTTSMIFKNYLKFGLVIPTSLDLGLYYQTTSTTMKYYCTPYHHISCGDHVTREFKIQVVGTSVGMSHERLVQESLAEQHLLIMVWFWTEFNSRSLNLFWVLTMLQCEQWPGDKVNSKLSAHNAWMCEHACCLRIYKVNDLALFLISEWQGDQCSWWCAISIKNAFLTLCCAQKLHVAMFCLLY